MTTRPASLLRLLLCCSFALAAPLGRARADEPDDEPPAETPNQKEAHERFADGNQRYALGDYDGAAQAFVAATQLDPTMPGPYRNLGLVYVAMRRCDMALPNFSTYLRLRPTGKHTARVETEIAKCKALLGGVPAVAQSELALVTVHPTSSGRELDGAAVKVDGLLRGTPVDLQVTPGKHTIRVERKGYAPAEREVEIKANSTVDVSVDLTPRPDGEEEGLATGGRTRRPLAWALLAGSAVALAVGAGAGIAESANWRDAVTLDRATHARTDLDPYRGRDDALSAVAYVGYGVGLATLAASAIVFVLDVKRGDATRGEPQLTLAPSVGPSAAGLAALGSF